MNDMTQNGLSTTMQRSVVSISEGDGIFSPKCGVRKLHFNHLNCTLTTASESVNQHQLLSFKNTGVATT